MLEGELLVLAVVMHPEVFAFLLHEDPDHAEAFEYPLLPNVPVVRTGSLSFTFPLPRGTASELLGDGARDQDAVLGLTLPDDVPPQALEALEGALRSHCMFYTDDERPADTLVMERSSSVEMQEAAGSENTWAKGIEHAASWANWGIRRSSEILADGIVWSAEKVKAETERLEPQEVSEGTKQVARGAREAAKGARWVTGGLVTGMCKLSGYLAKGVAEAAKNSEWTKDYVDPKTDGGKATKEVLATSVVCLADMYGTLLDAGKHLVTVSAGASSEVVKHRYGDDAGQVAKDATGAVKDVMVAGLEIEGLGVKGLAKGVAKGAAREMFLDQEGAEKAERLDLPSTAVLDEDAKRHA